MKNKTKWNDIILPPNHPFWHPRPKIKGWGDHCCNPCGISRAERAERRALRKAIASECAE